MDAARAGSTGSTGSAKSTPKSEAEDLFSWMFLHPDLFPLRSELAASDDGLSLFDEQDFPLPAKQEGEEEEEEEEEELPSTTTAPSSERERRLEKNREIARNCRKRKREKQQSLEEEVKKLREWNSQLEAKLLQIHPETMSREVVRKQDVEEIYALSEQSRDETAIQEKLNSHKEVYADFGKERKQAISYHLEQLKILLLPNQVSKMTLFVLQQEDEFYNEERNKTTFGGGIWNLLTEELGLSAEQKNTLLNMRKEIRSQRLSVSKCLSTLRELESRVRENLMSSVAQMAKVQQLTTPSQQAKFLWWIERNRPTAELLNNLWERKMGGGGGSSSVL